MKQPVICDTTKGRPSFPEFCDEGYWEVPVNSLADIKVVNRDHAYILPDDSIWVLNYDASGFVQLNGGTGGGGQPTIIRNGDGLIKVSGSGTYLVQVDVKMDKLREELAIEELSDKLNDHVNDKAIHVTTAEKDTWHKKQNELTAGTNITISGDVISAMDSQEVMDHMKDTTIHVTPAEKATWDGKQDKLIAGNHITIANDEISADLSSKQDVLVSGTNIKTVNGQSLLGSGDITVAGSSERVFIVNKANPGEVESYSAAVDTLTFNLIKTSRNEWMLTVTNNHIETATLAYQYMAFYTHSLQTGGNTSALITLAPGDTSPTLDIDSLGLGYGSAKLSVYDHYIHVYFERTQESHYYKVISMLDKSMTDWHLVGYVEKVI